MGAQNKSEQSCSHEADILVGRSRHKKKSTYDDSGDIKWEAKGLEADGGHWGMLHLERVGAGLCEGDMGTET